MTESTAAINDFSGMNEEETQVEGTTGGGFTRENPLPGVALLRLKEVLEFGLIDSEYKGKAKTKRPVSLTFELVHPRHAIRKRLDTDKEGEPATGEFIRNHEVTVRLNKSFFESAAYYKLFNKMNFDGRVSTPKGKVPSFVGFINSAFLGEITLNTVGEGDKAKTYVNLDKDGEFQIGAPKLPNADDTGAPDGTFRDIAVPEMQGEQRVFLWETGVDDAMYTKMWDSIEIVGEKKDGTAFKNWIQDQVRGSDEHPNKEWEGSRAQALFDTDHAELDATLEAGLTADPLAATATPAVDPTTVPSVEAPVADAPAPTAPTSAVEDPLAGL